MFDWTHTCRLAGPLVVAMLVAGCGDIHSRTDFSAAVQNRSEEEVTKEFGKPVSVDAEDPKRVVWTYAHKTFDTENQDKRDANTLVIFGPGDASGKLKVIAVEFRN